MASPPGGERQALSKSYCFTHHTRKREVWVTAGWRVWPEAAAGGRLRRSGPKLPVSAALHGAPGRAWAPGRQERAWARGLSAHGCSTGCRRPGATAGCGARGCSARTRTASAPPRLPGSRACPRRRAPRRRRRPRARPPRRAPRRRRSPARRAPRPPARCCPPRSRARAPRRPREHLRGGRQAFRTHQAGRRGVRADVANTSDARSARKEVWWRAAS